MCGFSAGEDYAEEYAFQTVQDGSCTEVSPLQSKEEMGIVYAGQTEALDRLLNGYSPSLADALTDMFRLPEKNLVEILAALDSRLNVTAAHPQMPLGDAVKLAIFLVRTAINYEEFTSGFPVIGEPIDVATITRHEGFTWIQRKGGSPEPPLVEGSA